MRKLLPLMQRKIPNILKKVFYIESINRNCYNYRQRRDEIYGNKGTYKYI